MKFLSVFLPFLVATSTARVLPRATTFTSCGTSADVLQGVTLTVSPDPPVRCVPFNPPKSLHTFQKQANFPISNRGSPVALHLQGTVAAGTSVQAGATYSIKVEKSTFLGYLTIINDTDDFCAETVGTPYACPIQPGAIDYTQSLEIPDETPSVRFFPFILLSDLC